MSPVIGGTAVSDISDSVETQAECVLRLLYSFCCLVNTIKMCDDKESGVAPIL